MIAAAVRRLARTAILATFLSTAALAQHAAPAAIRVDIEDLTPSGAALSTLRPSPEDTLKSVAALLQAGQPIHIKLVAYVGARDGNALTAADKSVPTVAIPVEDDPVRTSETMARGMTQAMRISMGTMTGVGEHTIGETVLAEGLAMRVARTLFPDRPENDFVEARPGWLAEADAKRGRILLDVRSVLNDKDGDTVTRFTMGQGPAGLEREAYYAAWLVTGYWLAHGETFAEIARVKEPDAPTRVAEAIDKLLLEQKARQSMVASPGDKQ
jgi:hypothetical protein